MNWRTLIPAQECDTGFPARESCERRAESSSHILAALLLFVVLLSFPFVQTTRADDLTIGNPEVLSETRIARTLFEYTMQAKLTNTGPKVDGVIATVTSTSPNTTIVQGSVNFGDVAPASIATGTFVIRHDRQFAFDPAVFQWSFAFAPTKIETSPANGETEVSPIRETIIRLTRPLAADAVVNDTNLFAIANGDRLPGTIHVAADRRTVSLFYANPLSPSTEVRVTLIGDSLHDDLARAIDAEGDGQPGGTAQISFRTLPLTRIPGTTVWGYVFDSYYKNPDGTDIPIVGATIRVDAFPEIDPPKTDATGRFELHDMPAPVFFVHIDGTTATNAPAGTMYPSVGKPFHSVPGQSTQLIMDRVPFHVYLPPMATGDIRPLSPTADTTVGFGPGGKAELAAMFPGLDPIAWDRVHVTIPAGSATDAAGNKATQAVIIPVPPNRLPAPLSPNLNPRLVISVQALGATRFDVPAPVTFPNLDGLAPGEKELFMSFNHAAGRWEVIGTGTVSQDGLTITSDPGVGILAPGWHLVQVGTITQGQPCTDQGCVLAAVLEGDVVKVDLSGTVAVSDIYDPNFRGLSIPGADILKDPDFSNNGIFFVAPRPQIGPGTSNPLDPPDLTGSFTADLVHSNQQRDAKSGVIRIVISQGYSTSGPNSVTAGVDKESVFRTQQRLRYFGWPSSSQLPVQVDGNLNDATRHAIGLFDSAVQNQHTLTLQATIDQNWINASPLRAPLWRSLPATGIGWYRVDSDDHAWGTSWAKELIDAAGFTQNVPVLPVNDLSLRLGGYTGSHPSGGHATGIDIDIDTPSRDDADPTAAFDDPWYRVWIAGNGKKYLATTDTRDANQNLVRNIVRYDPGQDTYYASPLDPPPNTPPGNFDHLGGC